MTSPTVDYTARDFDSILAAFYNHLKTRFPDTYKNFYASGISTAWAEMVAYAFDALSLMLDVSANELFVTTARDRASMVRLGRGVGYRLRGPTGASVVCKATPAGGPFGVDIIIDAGQIATTTSNVPFVTILPQRIVAGTAQGDGTLVFSQGEVRSETFAAPGTAWYKQRLQAPNIVEDSVVVTVDGVGWDEVESLVWADTTSKVFAWERDADGYITILFGDGVNGMVPTGAAVVVATYRVGGGVVGNIDTSLLQGTIQGYKDGTGEAVSITIINDEERGSGGEEEETLEHARLWIPRWIQSCGLAVTEVGIDSLAQNFVDPVYGRVALAKSMLKQEIPELNTVTVRIWGRDGGGEITTTSAGLKAALDAYFSNDGEGAVRLICLRFEILDGDIVYIDIDVHVVLNAAFAASDVTTSVTAALDGLLSGDAQQPGESVRLSKVYDAIQDAAGVTHALVNTITASMKTTEAVGLGDAIKTEFLATLALEPGLPIVARTVRVEAGAQVLADDGEGNLTGNGTGTVDYGTGDIHMDFTNVVESGSLVNVTYRHVIDYQRGDQELTADGTTRRFQGAVGYPPVVPYDVVSHEKGVAVSDGTQVATDDGDGNLIGTDVDPAGVNRIDYDTGSFDVTFLNTPGAGSKISSAYRQRLQTASEDIPITKAQVAVKGTYTITTE